jgi:hypothetical protein
MVLAILFDPQSVAQHAREIHTRRDTTKKIQLRLMIERVEQPAQRFAKGIFAKPMPARAPTGYRQHGLLIELHQAAALRVDAPHPTFDDFAQYTLWHGWRHHLSPSWPALGCTGAALTKDAAP